jgi:hypothetical protein
MEGGREGGCGSVEHVWHVRVVAVGQPVLVIVMVLSFMVMSVLVFVLVSSVLRVGDLI